MCTSMTLSSGALRTGSFHTSWTSVSRETTWRSWRSRYCKSSNSRGACATFCSSSTTRTADTPALLRRSTRVGMPGGAVGQLLEVRAREEAPVQVLRVLHDRRHDEPDVAVVLGSEDVEVLRQHRIGTVRNAVLAQIARFQVGRHNFQGSARPGWRSAKHPAASSAQFPLR